MCCELMIAVLCQTTLTCGAPLYWVLKARVCDTWQSDDCVSSVINMHRTRCHRKRSNCGHDCPVRTFQKQRTRWSCPYRRLAKKKILQEESLSQDTALTSLNTCWDTRQWSDDRAYSNKDITNWLYRKLSNRSF